MRQHSPQSRSLFVDSIEQHADRTFDTCDLDEPGQGEADNRTIRIGDRNDSGERTPARVAMTAPGTTYSGARQCGNVGAASCACKSHLHEVRACCGEQAGHLLGLLFVMWVAK